MGFRIDHVLLLVAFQKGKLPILTILFYRRGGEGGETTNNFQAEINCLYYRLLKKYLLQSDCQFL